MSKPGVHIYPDLEQLSLAAAERFAGLVRGRPEKADSFVAALSGGSTPRRLYELLAVPPYRTQIPWESVHLFQVDERCVPPDHTESNYRMVRETLLRRVPLPETNFHRMTAEHLDRDEAARQYAAELARVLRPEQNKCPRLDLVFLGLGSDGHTASLFPDSPALEEKKLWVRSNFVRKMASYRLTLTFPVLNAAARIVFLVSGAEKAETLRRVFDPDTAREPIPARRICPADGEVSWYVDKAAARLLKEQRG